MLSSAAFFYPSVAHPDFLSLLSFLSAGFDARMLYVYTVNDGSHLMASSKIPTGRGTVDNRAGRFARRLSEDQDDGWWQEQAPASAATEVRSELSRSIITRNRSPDIGFEQSINPYRGCEHGCIYCYARPSHAYWDMSPGLDFETRLIARENSATLLGAELSRPGYQCKPINLGANTDPYQPIERKYLLTRQCLEVLLRFRHPVTVVTKSALVLRDLDLLTDLARQNLVRVMVSLTTLDDDLKRRLEPRTASGTARLRVVRQLSERGIPVGVLLAPMIPAINDSELESLVEAAAAAGAHSAHYILLRLPWEVAPLFEGWLREHYPLRAEHVLSLIRQCRGGELNDPGFGSRFRGQGPFADLLEQRFRAALRRAGLTSRGGLEPLDCSAFSPPGQQLGLF